MAQGKILSRAFFCRNRFSLTHFQTRFGTEEWFIGDHHALDRNGLPEVRYQGDYKGALAFIAREQEKIYA